MTISAWLKTVTLWVAILMLAILNGMLRVGLIIPALGGIAGLITSGLLLSVCILVVAWIAAPWYGPLISSQWLLIGLCWLLLTLIFEFSFGHFVQNKTWGELLDAYTFKGGNIWPFVLVTTFIAPWFAAKIRNII